MSEINQTNIPSEEELHTFIEGELSAFEEQAILSRLEGQTKAVRGLELLRADREMLSQVVDPAPPEGLIADCLAQIERDLLISEDPMAPPIAFAPRRSRMRLKQLAAAAMFLLVVGVGGGVIFKNVLLTPDTIRFGDEDAWDKAEADDAAGLLADGTNADGIEESPLEEGLEDTNLTGDAESRLMANSGATITRDPGEGEETAVPGVAVEFDTDPIKRVAVNLQPLSDRLPLSVADAERLDGPKDSALSADVGLAVRLAALDRGSALDRLRALMNEPSAGTALIYNVPPIDTLPSHNNGFETVVDPGRWLANSTNDTGNGGGAAKIRRSDNRPQVRDAQRNRNESRSVISTIDQLRLVPLADQHAYRDDGYEYTLVGTAAQLQAILQEMNDGKDVGRVRVLRRNADGTTTVTSLLDLLPPARPAPLEWTRALCWWENPERNLELARRLVESYQAQPVLRIPLIIARR